MKKSPKCWKMKILAESLDDAIDLVVVGSDM